MAAFFFDSSAVTKLYHLEAGSAVVAELVKDAVTTILISRLAVVEVQSAFAGKVRAGLISAADATGLRHRFLEDVARRVFRIVALTGDHYDRAAVLIERHGAGHGLRTLERSSTRRRVEPSRQRCRRQPRGRR